MKNVLLNVKDLLNKMEMNKVQHVKDYEDALEGYWISLSVELLELSTKADRKEDVGRYIQAEKPVSHEDDYNTAIEMLTWERQQEIMLDASDFDRFVLDKWDWKGDFLKSQVMYNSKMVG